MKFSKTHEWVEVNGNIATIGVTDYAQNEMGDIVYVDLPEVGTSVEIGGNVCELESVKAVAPVESPVKGNIVEVNGEVDDDPAKVNADAMNTWLVKVEFTEISKDLLSDADYKKYIKTL